MKMKEYVIKMGIGTTEIEGEDYAVLMLDHIDLDSLLRTAAIMELIKGKLKPLRPEHPHLFGVPTEVTGIDDEMAVSISKVKKMITIKMESRSNLNDILATVDEATIQQATKYLPDTFIDFNRHRKYFSQQATMVYSGIYKNSYRNFINTYQKRGYYLVILGNNGTPMPGVQLVKEDIEITPAVTEVK